MSNFTRNEFWGAGSFVLAALAIAVTVYIWKNPIPAHDNIGPVKQAVASQVPAEPVSREPQDKKKSSQRMLTGKIAAAAKPADSAPAPASEPTINGDPVSVLRNPIMKPVWINEPPSWKVHDSYLSAAAREARASGIVKTRCWVDGDGHLTNCRTINENPTGYELGATAIKVAYLAQMAPNDQDGVPVKGRVFEFEMYIGRPASEYPSAPTQ